MSVTILLTGECVSS